MTQWNEGYVSDLSYAGGVYRQQMPSHLDALCLVAGVSTAVEPGAPFDYCELGCGVGDTAMAVAASYPQARVWGYDFNPAHIAQGSACADRAGLDNLVFAERSFKDLAEAAPADLPMLNYVTMHGVWSWVSPANRAYIVDFLRKHLKPGGIFTVSYNAMPGWAGTIALQHLLFESGRRSGGNSATQIREGVALAQRMVEVGGSALETRQVARLSSMLARGAVQYLSHEYLNEWWSPVFHADVVAALAPAKLNYVGSANLLENIPQLCAKPEQNALLDSLPESMRQSVQDYFCPRSFRRDVFVRGVCRLPVRERVRRLRSQRLALTVQPKHTTLEVDVPIGKATLDEAFYAPALATLGREVASVGDLVDAARPGTAPASEEIVTMLMGTGLVLPVYATSTAASRSRIGRYNQARIADALNQNEHGCWLASPIAGASIHVDTMSMLIYEVVEKQPDEDALSAAAIRSRVLELMAERGMTMNPNKSNDVEEADIDAEIDAFILATLPIWRRLHML